MRKPKCNRKRVLYDAKRFALVGVPYSIALKEAWRVEKFRVLKQMLATGIVEFRFKQAGAAMQRMTGTTMPHAIPKQARALPIVDRRAYVSVFDTEQGAWRNLNVSTVDLEFV
jgi:hypothetical protein